MPLSLNRINDAIQFRGTNGDYDVTITAPETQSFSGSGQEVRQGISIQGGLTVVRATHSGESNFQVSLANDSEFNDNFINVIGDFDGAQADLIKEGDSRRERGTYLTNDLLDLENPPTALFTGNNLTTLGALSAIIVRGLSVPEDVALVGYDDIPWAMALNPPPTVIDQPGYEMGRRAARILLNRLASPDRSPTTVTLQPKLIVRQSCGGDAPDA